MEAVNQISPVNWESNPYQFYINSTLPAVLNETQQQAYYQIGEHYANCFQLAKEQKLLEAKAALDQGDKLLKMADDEVSALVAVFSLPYISYYYYKIKNYTRAIRKTKYIISQIIQLEHAGQEYLFFSKIQQQQNIGRIYWASGDYKRSIPVYADCALKIFAQAGNWNGTQQLNGITIKQLVSATEYDFYIQVIAEASNRLVMLYKTANTTAVSLLAAFLKPLYKLSFADKYPENTKYHVFDSFLATLKSLVLQDEGGFIELATQFIENETNDEILRKIICRYVYYLDYQQAS